MVLATTVTERRVIGLALELAAPPFMPLTATTVTVRLDNILQRTVSLSATVSKHNVALQLSAGERTVAVQIIDPMVGQFVRVRLVDTHGRSLPWNVQRDRQKLYKVAAKAEPLIMHVQESGWLRVDEWYKGTARSQ